MWIVSGEVWTLHDHQRLKTIRAKRDQSGTGYRRLNSIITSGTGNLGYIPENSALPSLATVLASNTSDYTDHSLTRSCSLDAGLNYTDPSQIQLQLSDMDLSLSSDQFSLRRSAPSRTFYEAFGTPRGSTLSERGGSSSETGEDKSNSAHFVHKNSLYLYPNISLNNEDMQPAASTPHSSQRSHDASQRSHDQSQRSHDHTHKSVSQSVDPAMLFTNSLPLPINYGADARLTNQSITSGILANQNVASGILANQSVASDALANESVSGVSGKNKSRISYLMQIAVGETVRMKPTTTGKAAYKKRRRANLKGTVHYSVKTDMHKRRL